MEKDWTHGVCQWCAHSSQESFQMSIALRSIPFMCRVPAGYLYNLFFAASPPWVVGTVTHYFKTPLCPFTHCVFRAFLQPHLLALPTRHL